MNDLIDNKPFCLKCTGYIEDVSRGVLVTSFSDNLGKLTLKVNNFFHIDANATNLRDFS